MKCPDCKVDLVIFEQLEYDYRYKNICVSVAGKCPECRRAFLWEQHFTLENEDKLEDDI